MAILQFIYLFLDDGTLEDFSLSSLLLLKTTLLRPECAPLYFYTGTKVHLGYA